MKNLFLIIVIFLCILLLNGVQSQDNTILDTDCIQTAGYSGKECISKTTFINNSDWNFIIEKNEKYFCCYYKGKLYENYYNGCFPFKDNEIVENNINSLISKMEKGNWEYAQNKKIESPIVDCYFNYINYKINNLIIIFIIILYYL